MNAEKLSNVMNASRTLKRAELLKAMDCLVRSLNNEEGEDWWLMEGVPDGADFDDYAEIANDECAFMHCQVVFCETITHYGKDGWYA